VSRIQRQWGLNVDVRVYDLASVPIDWWADVCLLVQEALVNAGRHAGASSCTLEIGVNDGQVSIVVADNGRGFSLKGHYDHGQLVLLGLGPSTLRERAALLGGTVTIDSRDTGSRVEIRLPLARGTRST
jgi:signal transduction histidine kinase